MNYQSKIEQIVSWLKKIYGDKSAIIAVSGGVDSAVAVTLLVKALGDERVIPVTLPYGNQDMRDAKNVIGFNGLMHKAIDIDIHEMVDLMKNKLNVDDDMRVGNVMARVRMIAVFDIAKKMGALVCGTENKSELELGYFTRFGDAASDVEPISTLYKTDVWEVAGTLGLPEIFYTKEPSAGLWEGQTDAKEMGFSYIEADKILKSETEGVNPEIVRKVREMVAKNKFKLEVPYVME